MSSEKGRMFSHLQWKDRLRIEKMLKEKKSKAEIARTLRVDYTTIMREVKRGQTIQRDTNLVDRLVYCAETAERKYQENLRAKGPDIKLGNDHELANYIEGKIADDGYSPEAALHKIKEDGLTFSVTLSKWTVYKYINDGVFLRVTNKSLRWAGRKRQSTRRYRRQGHRRARASRTGRRKWGHGKSRFTGKWIPCCPPRRAGARGGS